MEMDVIKVNGKLTELDVLTVYELDVEIGKELLISKSAHAPLNCDDGGLLTKIMWILSSQQSPLMKTLDWNVEMLVTNSNFLSYIENILNHF